MAINRCCIIRQFLLKFECLLYTVGLVFSKACLICSVLVQSGIVQLKLWGLAKCCTSETGMEALAAVAIRHALLITLPLPGWTRLQQGLLE
jgi:hypothetical protein